MRKKVKKVEGKFYKMFFALLIACAIALFLLYFANFSTGSQTGKVPAENFAGPGSALSENEGSASRVIFVSANFPMTKEERLFLKELSRAYSVEFANEEEAKNYAETGGKEKLIFIALGNGESLLKPLIKNFSKELPETGKGRKLPEKGTSFLFEKTINILNKKVLIEKHPVKETLFGIKVMRSGTVSEFVQASDTGLLFNDALRTWIEGNPKNFSRQEKGPVVPIKISEKVADLIYSPYGETTQIVCIYRTDKQGSSGYIHYAVQTLNTVIPETEVRQTEKPETKIRFQLKQLKVRVASTNPNAELTSWDPTTMSIPQGKQQNYSVYVPINNDTELSWKNEISGAEILDCTIPSQRSSAWELHFAQNSPRESCTFVFEPGSCFIVKGNEDPMIYASQSVTFTEHRHMLPDTSVMLKVTGSVEAP